MVIGCCICGCREKWKGGIPNEETLGSDGYFHSLNYSNRLSFVYICDIYQIVHCKHVQFIASQLYLNKPVFKISHNNHSLARTLMSNFSPGIVISLLYSLMCSAKEGLNI